MGRLTWLAAIDGTVLAIFAVDIVVGFFTSYINTSTGDEIFAQRMIALNYIFHGTFWVDVVSTVPLEYLTKEFEFEPAGTGKWYINVFCQSLSLLKMIRIKRVSKIIANLN